LKQEYSRDGRKPASAYVRDTGFSILGPTGVDEDNTLHCRQF